jgi:hypothetical protein
MLMQTEAKAPARDTPGGLAGRSLDERSRRVPGAKSAPRSGFGRPPRSRAAREPFSAMLMQTEAKVADAKLAASRPDDPVRAGRDPVALGLDLAGELDRAAEQQQLLGQRGLAGSVASRSSPR